MSSEGLQSVAAEEFRRACGRFASGVTVASITDEQGAAHGLTVSSFTSVSLEPPLILICLAHSVTEIEAFRRARHFGISILREQDREVSTGFASKGHGRFNSIAWRRGHSGVPLIDCSLATLECETHHRMAAGDHDILIGRVIHTQVEDGAPLLHYASRYHGLAHD